MNLFKKPGASGALLCLWLLGLRFPATAAAADDSQLFAFKFSTNQPLTYAITIKSKTVSDSNIAGKTSLVSNSSELRYKLRLTAYKKNPDGTTSVYFKPYQVAQDLESAGPSHVVTQIRGLKINRQQNGIVVIDTEKNLGMSQVGQIKLGLYPNLLSGIMDFDPAGGIRKFEGDLPFVDYWTNQLKNEVGYFRIQFPDHPVAVRQAWTQAVTVTSGGGATLADPLILTNTFTRDLDLVTNENPVAVFGLTSSDHLQNLSGYFEQMGQKSSLNISHFDHDGFGTFHFDPKRGVLLDAKDTDTGDISIEMLVQGNTATSHVNLRTEIQMDLIADAPSK